MTKTTTTTEITADVSEALTTHERLVLHLTFAHELESLKRKVAGPHHDLRNLYRDAGASALNLWRKLDADEAAKWTKANGGPYSWQ